VTSELIPRVYKHKLKLIPGFTARYNVCDLVYYEIHEDINVAIKREKTLKRWRKQWKVDLIEKDNPEWGCLYSSLLGQVS
jgi:putative endonuclease